MPRLCAMPRCVKILVVLILWSACNVWVGPVAVAAQEDGSTPTVRIEAAPATPSSSDSNGSSLFPTMSLAPSTATIAPTTTWSPTGTALPTKSASPTSEPCNICGRGNVITSANDILLLPPNDANISNLTCTEAGLAGQEGLLTASNCRFLQSIIADTANTTNICGCIAGDDNSGAGTGSLSGNSYPICNICPPGLTVTTRTGEIPSPPLLLENNENSSNDTGTAVAVSTNAVVNEMLQCGFVDEGGASGLWDQDVCAELQVAADVNGSNPCGCGLRYVDEETNESESNTTSCSICGDVKEPNTLLRVNNATADVTVDFPDEFLALLPPNALLNESFFTCGSLEQSGTIGELWDPASCAFLQMTAADVCMCESVALPTDADAANADNDTLGRATVPSATPTSGSNAAASSVSRFLLFLSSCWFLLVVIPQ